MEIIENLDAPLGNSVFSQGQLNSKNLLELFNQQKAYNSSNLFPFQLHLLSYTAGLVAGQSWCEEKIKTVEKQPIAYLYNGIRLPALPEWDKETYPYAFISFNSYVQQYFLTVSTDIGYRYMTVDEIVTMGLFCQYICEPDGEAWSMYREDNGELGAILHGTNREVVWSNSDILVEGSEEVRFTASDPIPVYESDEPEKQPIAYLYNGVQLPSLPEWDKVKYPYAAIETNEERTYFVLIITEKPVRLRINTWNMAFIATEPTQYITWDIGVSSGHDGAWGGEYSGNKDSVDNSFGTFGSVLWANFDVLKEDGALHLSASEPIPVYDSDEPEKQPIAYSYNGVILPTLPEWDREMYPYAFVSYINGQGRLAFLKSITYIVNSSSGERAILISSDNAIYYRLAEDTNGVQSWILSSSQYSEFTISKIIWANFDVLNEDGNVYLKASKPIPVYE